MSVLTLKVDEVMRTLSAESSNPFVVHDKEVDIVRFAINSGFADIVLDGQVALRVMYQRPGETEVRAQTLTYYDTDGLHNYYDWQLLQSDLAKNGSLTVALCILDISGGEVSEWHTTPCAVSVLSTIHTDDSDEGDDTITPTVKERVAVLETMIQRVASGAPIVVASTSAMTDTDQIYVLSTDGKWYYHNGTAWTAGGEYGGVAVGSITTDKLANKSVTTAKLDDNSVTWQKLASGAVHTGELADSAVTNVKLADSSVSEEKLASSAVTTAKIADGTITANKIASGVIPAVDTTLTQTGAAADAKAVGDELSDLKSAMSAITTVVEPINYIDISDDTFISQTVDVTKTYNSDGTVQFVFTATANPVLLYRLDGLTNGKAYILTFNLVSGSLAGSSNQKVGIWISGNNFHKTIAVATKIDNQYTIEFTAESGTLAFMLSLIYSSKTVVLGNFSVVEAEAVAKTVINNDALSDIPMSALSPDLQDAIEVDGKPYRIVSIDKNLLENISHTDRSYIRGSTGEVTPTGSSYSATDFIELEAEKEYYYNKVFDGYYAFYDSNKEYISGLNYQSGGGETGGYFVTPENTAYGRFTVNTSNLSVAWLSDENKEPTGLTQYALKGNYKSYETEPTNPCDYDGTEFSIFNRCVCVGDSLTQGVCNYSEGGQQIINVTFPNYAYPKQLQKLTGVEMVNHGIAGRTTAQWYSEKSSADLSGFDCAIVQLGVNDALYNDGWTTEESTALDNIITKLKNENNNIKIFVATIIPAISYQGAAFDSVSNGIRSFIETLDDDNVVLVDLANYGHTAESFAYNAGHLTAYGYLRLAMDYKSYLSWIIKTNPMKYRKVQFIGTNHDVD